MGAEASKKDTKFDLDAFLKDFKSNDPPKDVKAPTNFESLMASAKASVSSAPSAESILAELRKPVDTSSLTASISKSPSVQDLLKTSSSSTSTGISTAASDAMASIKSMTLPEVKAPTLPNSEDTAENLVSKFVNMAADIDKKTASK